MAELERIYDLSFTVRDDGSVYLKYDDHGEENIIVLHASQLRVIAERAGLIKPSLPGPLASVRGRLGDALMDLGFICDESLGWTDEIRKRLADGVLFTTLLHSIGNALDHIYADIPADPEDLIRPESEEIERAKPAASRNASRNALRNGVTDASNVAQEPGNGTSTGQALSNAERQAKWRASQKEKAQQGALELTTGRGGDDKP